MLQKTQLLRVLGLALAVYLIYALLTGVLAYLLPAHPQEVPPAETYCSAVTGPDRAALVETPREAFPRRVEVIRSARETLDVCCHCVKVGETTDCFFAELIRAADRGVKVRVLLDGAVGGLTGEHKNIDLALLSHPNIEYRAYNPVHLLKPWGWNVRLHDKFVLADDRMLLLGGRNIGDEYFDPPGYQGKVTHDRDVLILNTAAGTGTADSAAAQVKDYMALLWDAPETQVPKALSDRKQKKGLAEQARLRAIAQRWEATFPDFYLPKTAAEDIAVPTNRVTLITNPLGSFKKAPVIGASLAALLRECRDIRIQTPYATANPYTLAALRSFCQGGSQVDFLTNSPISTPNLPAFSSYYYQRQKFLDTGIHIYEYQSRNSIHGKSCTADGRLSAVGSFNLDDRSLYIDTESMLVIDSPAFTAVLDQCLDDLFAQTAMVGQDNAYLPSSVEVLEVSRGKQVLLWTVSLLSRPLRFLI